MTRVDVSLDSRRREIGLVGERQDELARPVVTQEIADGVLGAGVEAQPLQGRALISLGRERPRLRFSIAVGYASIRNRLVFPPVCTIQLGRRPRPVRVYWADVCRSPRTPLPSVPSAPSQKSDLACASAQKKVLIWAKTSTLRTPRSPGEGRCFREGINGSVAPYEISCEIGRPFCFSLRHFGTRRRASCRSGHGEGARGARTLVISADDAITIIARITVMRIAK